MLAEEGGDSHQRERLVRAGCDIFQGYCSADRCLKPTASLASHARAKSVFTISREGVQDADRDGLLRRKPQQ